MTPHEWERANTGLDFDVCRRCGVTSHMPMGRDESGHDRARGYVRELLIRQGENISFWRCPETCEETLEKIMAVEVQTS